MADVDETVYYRGDSSPGIKIRLVGAQSVDTDDTLTIDELNAILHAEAFRMDTGASITCTTATNVVTVNQAALVDVPVLVCITGT